MSRHLALVTFACLGLLGTIRPALAQDARFHLALAWTIPEIEPQERAVRTNRTIMVVLSKGGIVTEEVTRHGGRSAGRGRIRTQEGSLGSEVDGRALWKVLNENTLLRLVAERSHTFAIRLRTDGARSCSVTLEWRLKPGFTAYEDWTRGLDTPVRYRQPIVRQSTCTVL